MLSRNKGWRLIEKSFLTFSVGVILTLFAINLAAAGDRTISMQASHKSTREALVIINADTLFNDDLDSAIIQFHSGVSQDMRADFDYKKILNKIVNDRLLVQEARNMGIDKEDWLIKQMEKLRRDGAIRRYLADNFKPALEISDSAVLSYFKANYDKMLVRTISVKTAAEAQHFLDLIKGGASMDTLARDTSLDVFRFRGGLHGLMHRCDLEQVLRDQASKLTPGQMSPLFPNMQVYTILRLEEYQPADTAELALYKEPITYILKTEKSKSAWEKFVRELSTSVTLNTDSAGLQEIRNDSSQLYTQNFLKSSSRVVIRIDESHKITEEGFRTMLSKAAMSGGGQSFDSLFRNIGDRAREELILSAAADKANYPSVPVVVAAYNKSFDSALVEVYLKETIVPQIKFTRAEFETYYNQNLDRFREAESFLMDQMILKDSAKAFEVAQRLSDGADFAFLGKQFGDKVKIASADAQNEWISASALPAPVAQKVGALAIGASSPPFRTTEGWVIFRLKERRPGKLKPLSDVESSIKAIMFQTKFDAALDTVLAKIKADSNIQYKENAISKYFGKD